MGWGQAGEVKALPFTAPRFTVVSYISSTHQMLSSPGVGAQMGMLRGGDLEERREWEFLLPFLVEEWFLYRKEGKALLSCLRLISQIPSKHNHPTILYKRTVGTLEVHGLSATFAYLPGSQTERLGLNGHNGMVRLFFPHRSHGYSVLCQDLLTLWGVSAFGPLGGKGAKPQTRYREGTHSRYVWRKKALEPSGNKEKE